MTFDLRIKVADIRERLKKGEEVRIIDALFLLDALTKALDEIEQLKKPKTEGIW